jgi:predicted patatin/cPLA2 family phospholipase
MKLALVVQGGGTRGAYAAGVLDVLMKNGIRADAVYGTSAGALTGVNYVSEEPGRAKKVFLAMTKDRHFINPLNFITKGSIFNFNELFFELPKGPIPFDSKEFFGSKTEFYACATSCLTGQAVYFSKLDPEFWNGLAASASLPLATKPTFVHGVPYLDGGLVDSIPVQKALADGADKVIVVLTRSEGYRKGKMKKKAYFLAKSMYHKYPELLKAYKAAPDVYNAEMDFIDKAAKEGKIFAIYPSIPPVIGHAERNSRKVFALINEGTDDAEKCLPLLKDYLSK